MKQNKLQALLRRNAAAYLFLLPWIIGMIVFVLYPMITSLVLSFTNYSFGSNWSFTRVDNFAKMVSDRRYLISVKVTLQYVFIAVPVRLFASLAVALALNKGIRGLAVFRAVYYIPSLLGGSVAISLLWTQVFGTSGIFNRLLSFLGVPGVEGQSWITNPNTAVYTLIALLVWQFGASMIVFLAGLKQIPESLYEAARIDGAGGFALFRRITLPMLSPILLFNLVMEMINAFQAFTPAFIISNGKGGTLDSMLFYTLYLYIKGFNQFQMGYASAMAWVLLVFIGIITVIILKSSEKYIKGWQGSSGHSFARYCFNMLLVEDVIEPFGYSLLMCSTDDKKEKERRYLQLLGEKKVDGIILNTTGKNDALISSISKRIPIVLSNRKVEDIDFCGDLVDSDNFDGVFTLTKHLIRHGHKQIGVISGNLAVSTGRERFLGFVSAMKTIHVEVTDDYPYLFKGDFTAMDGYAGGKALLSQPQPPTAVIVMNNEMMVGALRYFCEAGIAVPQQVSVVSYGSITNGDLFYVRPTHVTLNPVAIGTKLAESIVERIRNRGSQEQMINREIRFSPSIVEGNSVAQITGL